jgi:ERF superfamily
VRAIVQRTSESIAALATALAKAQTELINPEKSLVATIREEGARGREQTFAYAPLSSGLDIVRKTLGQHEIATVQTTSIDQTAGIVNLTTVLAHSSGEWIASDWPVCPISETASPRRMGAALTYARRYALFALVGIAGEDDLDAPDLESASSEARSKPVQANGGSDLNGGQGHSHPIPVPHRPGKAKSEPVNPILGPHASAKLRQRLIEEIAELGSSDDAAKWAQQRLAEKNRMRARDAELVEASFETMLTQLTAGRSERDELRPPDGAVSNANTPDGRSGRPIDKNVLALPEPRRIRDRDHLRSVALHPCLICGRSPSDPHHLRFAQSRALSRKVSDEFTVPLCRGHHREVHRCGDEAAWWSRAGINALSAARALWLETHPLTTSGAAGSAATAFTASSNNDGNAATNPVTM